MTIRDYLRRQKRRYAAVVNLGVLVFIGGAIAGTSGSWLLALALVAFVVCGLGGLFLGLCVRCPNCGGRFGPVLGAVGSPFTVPANLRFCPFCGIGLDSPYPEKRAS
jgi:hypothetical protein